MSRSFSSCPNSETVELSVQSLGERVSEEAIVVGSCAVRAAMPDADVPGADIDLIVTEGAYGYLRSQYDWEEITAVGALPRLKHGIYDVRLNSEDAYNSLAGRSWQTAEGVLFAGLPDMYAFRQKRDAVNDRRSCLAIRTELQNPEKSLLPTQVMPHEIRLIQSCLPEALRDDPDAQALIHLAANGLFGVFTQYGHPKIGQTNQIIGALEAPEYGVAATYHNGFAVERDIRLLRQHTDNIQATDEELLLAIVGDAYSDIVYGNGRASDNPNAYDELLSAKLLRGHAHALGFTDDICERLYQIVLGTGFNEHTHKQRGTNHPDAVVRAVAGIDLQTLATPEAVTDLADLAIEDNMSERTRSGRTIGKVATEEGVRIFSIAEGLAFVDAYARARPSDAPDGPTVLQAYGRRIFNGGGFMHPDTGHKFPFDWTLDNPAMRRLHSKVAHKIGESLLTGRMNASDAYEATLHHAENMRRQFA